MAQSVLSAVTSEPKWVSEITQPNIIQKSTVPTTLPDIMENVSTLKALNTHLCINFAQKIRHLREIFGYEV